MKRMNYEMKKNNNLEIKVRAKVKVKVDYIEQKQMETVCVKSGKKLKLYAI
jgi:hypothetical protein